MQNKLVGKAVIGGKTTSHGAVATKSDVDVCMNGDRIESIIIHCECGQTHKIECQYDEPQEASE